MRFYTALVLLFILVFSAAGQEEENPDIFLPPVVLEVEDSGSQAVQLPDPEIPEQSPGLPGVLVEAEDPADPFSGIIDIPVIDPLDRGDFVSDRTFFSEGTIGLGSGNRLYGDIELTQLGTEGPGFTAGFLHDSSDGFFPDEPGQGYYSRRDRIYGSFVYLGDMLRFTAEGDFAENAWGLQEQSTYYDVTNRSAFAGAGTEYTRDWLSVSAGAELWYMSQVFGAASPVTANYTRVDPEITLSGQWNAAAVSLFVKGRLGEDSLWEGGGRVDITPRPWLTFMGGLSALGAGPELPWFAGIEFGYITGLTVGISGGVEPDFIEPHTLVDTAPMTPLENSYPYSLYRFIEADVMYAAANNLSFTGSSRLFWDRDRYWLASSVDADGLLPFRQSPYHVSFGGMHRLEIRYAEDLDWYISGGYEFDHTGHDLLGERNHLVFDAEYTLPGRRLIVAGGFELAVDNSEQPLLDLSAEIPLSDNVSFELSGKDLMGAVREEGRSYIGDYTRKGFEITLFAKISL